MDSVAISRAVFERENAVNTLRMAQDYLHQRRVHGLDTRFATKGVLWALDMLWQAQQNEQWILAHERIHAVFESAGYVRLPLARCSYEDMRGMPFAVPSKVAQETEPEWSVRRVAITATAIVITFIVALGAAGLYLKHHHKHPETVGITNGYHCTHNQWEAGDCDPQNEP